MSKSRLEKFLYALYSLDSSDLPNPLSRIEELYKCLVTGEEAPTFKPLSRVEKYLMAILGVYDVDSLPNPLSRVEVLLYKLATGDDNLDDFKSFLSEHEELLAEIIRNGGFGGNIDIEYVLYTLSTGYSTLYNTAEKPVKSAILKGMTANCLLSLKNITANASAHSYTRPLNVGETYTIFYNYTVTGTDMNIVIGEARVGNSSKGIPGTAVHNGKITEGTHIGKKVVTLTDTSSNILINWIRSGTGTLVVNELYCVEGDYSNVDIPFIPRGLNNVKMPVLTTVGKNLFDGELEKGIIDGITGEPQQNQSYVRSVNFIKVQSNTSYILSEKNDSTNFRIYEYDENFGYIGFLSTNPFTTTSNTSYIKFRTYPKNSGDDVSSVDFEIMLEKGNTVTTYEPYKSNILTTNEEVELRGIRDVKDELNLLTGELTQRIGEIILDGSEEGWTLESFLSNDEIVYFNLKDIENIKTNVTTPTVVNALTDKLKVSSYVGEKSTKSESYFQAWTNHFIGVSRNKLITQDVNGFKQWLSDNNLRINHQLSENSVKTVDLSVVNQDGNNTKLSTFNDITYVTLSSEGLIPEAELEVATKNKEVLSTMSLEMNDISTTQNALQETSDIQSENVDATMIATTEIYEELL